MINWDKAVAFVRQKGNNLDNLRLRCALGQPFTQKEAEEVLAVYQFPDGSWDYYSPEENSDRIGSLGGTIHCLRWLRELGLASSEQMARTLEFLVSIQHSDGSFYESEAKLRHSPQKWLQEDTIIDRFYFTAALPMRLFSLGYEEHLIVEPALKWLEHHWVDWELVTGTWYNVWALLCSPATVRMGSLYDRCYAKAVKWIPHLEPQPLTWFLDACHGCGYPKDEPLVAKGIQRLQTLQNEEGAWPAHASAETTITALRLLYHYGSQYAG
ncbi:MAG: hypothetical protein HXS48_06980 [Theionarchaea archaeon]|nr:hypothetical protein [Theionarchaea archaeon]